MEVIFAGQNPEIVAGTKILFLAGPTTRTAEPTTDITEWRQKALTILDAFHYDGAVCVPEPYTGAHDGQVEWEQEWLAKSTTIVFWIPRKYATKAYATTTNLEFGQYIAQGEPKVVYGRPDDSDSTRSNDWHARKNGVSIFTDLEELLKYAMSI